MTHDYLAKIYTKIISTLTLTLRITLAHGNKSDGKSTAPCNVADSWARFQS